MNAAANTEPRLAMVDLAGGTIVAVDPHPNGWAMRFICGRKIIVQAGHTFDAAGNHVIEPASRGSSHG